MTPALLLFSAFYADAAGVVPLRDGCSQDAAVVADVQSTDQITVRHGVAGEALPCYAVSMLRSGKEIGGYILGNSLAAVQDFERRRALESRISIPALAPVESSPMDRTIEDPGPLAGRHFKPWSGIDLHGKPVEIQAGEAKATVVTFWRPQSKAALAHAIDIEFMTRKFAGVKTVGFIVGASAGAAKYYMEDVSVFFPQVLDRTALASEFAVDASKGTTLVLDASGKVVASSSDAKKIRSVLTKMLAP